MTDENNEVDDYSDDHYSDDESFAEDQFEDEQFEDDHEYDDQQYDDQDFEDDREYEEDRQRTSRSKKKRKRMFCRGCNRFESHRRAPKKSWLNSYITGLTFGLNRFVGPFKCTCCGTNRWIIRLKKSNNVVIKR